MVFKEEIEESRLQEPVDVLTIQPQQRITIKEEPELELTKYVIRVGGFVSQDGDEAQGSSSEQKEQESNQDADEERRSRVPTTSRTCCGCSLHFESPEKLVAHSLQVHFPERSDPDEVRPYVCGICYKNLPNKNDLEHHERQFREDLEKFLCRKCGKAFYSFRSLKIHHNKSHGVKLVKCHMCPFVSLKQKILNDHIDRHSTRDGSFKCLVCKRSYNNPALLEKHSRSHQSKQPLKCPHCSKVFKKQYWLSSHILLHVKQGITDELEIMDE